MKQIEYLYHFTDKICVISSILLDGFKPSYASEKFGDRNILIPMVSFMNVLLRDVGKNEVVDYGSYGIGIRRDYATKININPVCYVYENSIVERTLKNLHDLSIIPQLIKLIKENMLDKVNEEKSILEWIKIKPSPIPEVKNLLDSISKRTEPKLIDALNQFVVQIYENAYHQLLLSKPYKVKNTVGETKIAYNEREWRYGYKDLGYIMETNINGVSDVDFVNWKSKCKPHFSEEKYRLRFSIDQISHIIIKEDSEKKMILELLNQNYGQSTIDKLIKNGKIKIGTLSNLKNQPE
ncbi:abortive infection system antitoxin AbiGi family protein [Abyssalbus ytuae]|uniref:Abortive infection system antitoxin AbiGi family protein n=1 Tax=Abyssalbus ytuae TaxID=2926907 RepID=A0A9E6ZLK2_9FLAO|nr:abortive infection system antitoxin AbiGi family protein [Abyssalbus ytuae]UOB16505.1 abortive infection system antitoxin AbiGi family protein [Abyssalbus ytuae]